jgi:predicted ATP-grasp superfamily ATP-dependent carboligase
MNNISQAIILSAGPNGLGALRSLYKENIRADIITGNIFEPVMSSRLPIRKVILKNAFDTEDLLAILLNWPRDGQVLIPTSDWYVDFLVTNETVLREKFDFVLPTGGLSQKFIDKQKEVELVKSFVELPKSIIHLPKSAQALKAELPLPLIIKPRSNELNKLGQKNIVINTDDELEAFYQEFEPALEFCIAQDLIIGDDHNLWVCNCVFDFNGELINAFTFQRLQLTPPHYGVTCYAESKLNDDVIEQVRALGKGLGYIGPAMVEFKLDDRDGSYKYIEINPRLGLCNYFDTSCGKNNVYAAYCVAKKLPFIEKPQKEGRMFLSLYEDLYSRFRDKQSVGHIFKTYLSNITKMHTFMYFAWIDPWPGIMMSYKQGKRTLRSIINKVN